MALWTPNNDVRDEPALWHRTGYWSPLNLNFVLNWMDAPWVGEGHHIAIDLECLIAGLITLAPRTAPQFEQFPRDEPTPEIDPVANPNTRRGYACACQVVDDREVGDEVFVLSGSNWSWTSFCEDNINRLARHFGQGYVPVLRLGEAKPLDLSNGGKTAVIASHPCGWIRRAHEMIEFARSRETIDATDPPILTSIAPPQPIAFEGPVPPLTIAAPSEYAKAKGGGEEMRKPAHVRQELEDDDIPF